MSDIQTVDPTTGKIYPSWAVQAVDALITKVKTRPMWETIDFLVEVFFKRYPEYASQWKASQAESRKLHRNRHASNKEKDLRQLADVPVALADLLEYFYGEEIRADKKKFWHKFVRRYPIFKVPDVI